MQSEITGNYILFRSCGKHSKQTGKNKSWIETNQVQVLSSIQENEEVLMDTMIIEDVDHIEVQQDSD